MTTATTNQNQDGAGDSSAVVDAAKTSTSHPVLAPLPSYDHHAPYEGSHQFKHDGNAANHEKAKPTPPVSQFQHQPKEEKNEGRRNRPKSKSHHRRLEDQKHLLQFDFLHEMEQMKEKAQQSITTTPTPTTPLPPAAPSFHADHEVESSPLIEDESAAAVRKQRQLQYRDELRQQLARREQERSQRVQQRKSRPQQRPGPGPTAASLESYEKELRMEQLAEMRRHVQARKEREVERLKRLYRNDKNKLMAHLHRLKLQDAETPPRNSDEPLKPPAVSRPSDSDRQDSSKWPEPEVHYQATPSEEMSPNTLPGKEKEEQEEEKAQVIKKKRQTASLAATEPKSKPLTFRRAFQRLQEQWQAEQMLEEERRAKAAAWRADAARRERLERDVRNLADWRSGHSLAGVPITLISPAQKKRFEDAADWLQKQRTEQQKKRIDTDRQLAHWREEKDRIVKETRMREKAEEKIAKELANERKKEAEKSFQRWMLEVQARKAAERASVPKGATGVSTYNSSFTIPTPWRRPPKKVWRGNSCTSSAVPAPSFPRNQKVKIS